MGNSYNTFMGNNSTASGSAAPAALPHWELARHPCSDIPDWGASPENVDMDNIDIDDISDNTYSSNTTNTNGTANNTISTDDSVDDNYSEELNHALKSIDIGYMYAMRESAQMAAEDDEYLRAVQESAQEAAEIEAAINAPLEDIENANCTQH